jgi:ATP-dependent protease ClpP protease subunit
MNLIQIENKAGKIRLNDIVMQPVMDELIAEIGKIFGAKAASEGIYTGELTNYAENAVDELEIVIHSPGGSVLDGYTLYNEIKALRARGVVVTATINSLAASMASVIAMACDKIQMVPNGRMMIHEVKQGVHGDADKLADAAKTCDSMSQEIAEIYAERTGSTVSDMRAMMKKETWMGAKDALAGRFIDAIVDIRAANPTKNAMNILKMLFPGNEAEISQVEAQLAEVDSLRNDIAMFTAEKAQLVADITAKDQTIAEHVASIASRDEAITALTGEKETLTASIDQAKADLAAKDVAIEAAKNSATQTAVETLAAIGQTAPLPNADENAPVDHIAKLSTLKGSERTEYYANHGEAIRAQLTK